MMYALSYIAVFIAGGFIAVMIMAIMAAAKRGDDMDETPRWPPPPYRPDDCD